MRHPYLASLGVIAVLVLFIALAAVSISGQTPGQAPGKAPAQTPAPATKAPAAKAPATVSALPKAGPAPRTAWGVPDLQGTWFVMEQVPLERSAANANKDLLTDAEVAALDVTATGAIVAAFGWDLVVLDRTSGGRL